MSEASERKQALREPNTRILLLIATTLGVLGIALAASGGEDLPKVLTLVGLLAMIVGLHRYGRLGPDAPIQFASPIKAAKKKKKRAPS
jgi:hypothetical protein